MGHYRLRVSAEYYQYCLITDDTDLGEPDTSGGNGLLWVNPDPGAAVVFTGVDTGHIDLTVDTLDHEPALADLDDWEDIVEASWTATGDGFTLGGPTAVEDVELVDLPAAPGQTRTYRVRVCARGRDQGREAGYIDADDGDELLEHHHILIWPAPHAPERSIKLTDKVGAQHRAGD